MALNKLTDLNNHLFAQLERLGDEDLDEDSLLLEVKRSKAIGGLARNVIGNARLMLDSVKFSVDNLPGGKGLPEQFKLKKCNDE